jgi:hypothetical protein
MFNAEQPKGIRKVSVQQGLKIAARCVVIGSAAPIIHFLQQDAP